MSKFARFILIEGKKKVARKIPVVIPFPTKKVLKQATNTSTIVGPFEVVAHRPTKAGEIVYSFVRNEILVKDHATTTSYWILKKK